MQNVLHPLRHALDRGTELGPRGVMAFDLDSTLFDNKPRQARILRELGKAKNLPALQSNQPKHWSSGWDMKGAMLKSGLTPEEVEANFEEARRFWKERFFTSAYCVDDVAIPGAVDFLARVLQTGVTVAYVTGRHEEMRQGTVACLQREGLPIPGDRVHLVMKPTFEQDDDSFKRVAHERLRGLGTLVAAFDNEPTHVNDYKRAFPDAFVVHLATDHSGRPVEVLEGIASVKDFVIAPTPAAEVVLSRAG